MSPASKPHVEADTTVGMSRRVIWIPYSEHWYKENLKRIENLSARITALQAEREGPDEQGHEEVSQAGGILEHNFRVLQYAKAVVLTMQAKDRSRQSYQVDEVEGILHLLETEPTKIIPIRVDVYTLQPSSSI